MKRRTFVKSAISMMTVAATRPTLWAALQADSGTTLKDEAARKGIIYGSAATQGALSKDRAYADLFVRECAMLVTEREFRWDVIQPEQDRYDFNLADWQHDFAMKNGLKFRGHSLAGNGELPQWAKSLNPRSAPAV